MKTKQPDPTVATRVPQETVDKIEEFRKRLEAKTPGVKVRQSDALRVIIEKGLR